jgi:hypothetical protein
VAALAAPAGQVERLIGEVERAVHPAGAEPGLSRTIEEAWLEGEVWAKAVEHLRRAGIDAVARSARRAVA